MSEHADTTQLILDSAERLFRESVDKALLDAAEAGEFPEALWQLVVEQGYNLLGRVDSGTSAGDLFTVLKVAGHHALPLPLAETLLGGRWCQVEGLVSVGVISDESIVGVPWGRKAETVIGFSPDQPGTLRIVGEVNVLSEGANIAGEPRDVVALHNARTLEIAENAFDALALSRVAMACGGLARALALSLIYAGEREQFGRKISAFQAIQHTLAVMAAEVAAAVRAGDAAIAAFGSERAALELAAAKARVGEAIGIVAESAHQVHGAMGFTYEHQLHHCTRRLWAWRDEYGTEAWWQERLGRAYARMGADAVWPAMAVRG